MNSTRLNKAGNDWNDMNYLDRANWLRKSSVGHSGWANESWNGLPESIREAFISHVRITKAIYRSQYVAE